MTSISGNTPIGATMPAMSITTTPTSAEGAASAAVQTASGDAAQTATTASAQATQGAGAIGQHPLTMTALLEQLAESIRALTQLMHALSGPHPGGAVPRGGEGGPPTPPISPTSTVSPQPGGRAPHRTPLEKLENAMKDIERRATTPELKGAAQQLHKLAEKIKAGATKDGNVDAVQMTRFSALRSRFHAMEQGNSTVAYDSLLRRIDTAHRASAKQGSIDKLQLLDIRAQQRLIELSGDTRPSAVAARNELTAIRSDLSKSRNADLSGKREAAVGRLARARIQRAVMIANEKPTQEIDARIATLTKALKPQRSSGAGAGTSANTTRMLEQMLEQVRKLAEKSPEIAPGPRPE